MEAYKERESDLMENKCKKCGSSLTYIRFKAKERVCRYCGHREKMK